jgi:hypothetical protein
MFVWGFLSIAVACAGIVCVCVWQKTAKNGLVIVSLEKKKSKR